MENEDVKDVKSRKAGTQSERRNYKRGGVLPRYGEGRGYGENKMDGWAGACQKFTV